MLMIFAVLLCNLAKGPERDSNPDLCDAGTELYELSCQANWELVIMWAKMEATIVGHHYVDQNISRQK